MARRESHRAEGEKRRIHRDAGTDESLHVLELPTHARRGAVDEAQIRHAGGDAHDRDAHHEDLVDQEALDCGIERECHDDVLQ